MPFLVFLLTLGSLWILAGVRPGFPGLFIAVVAMGAYAVFSGLARTASDPDRERPPAQPAGRVCPNAHCGRMNEPRAKFCAQCGSRLF